MPPTKKAAARRVPTATEPIAVNADVETWQNETQGTVVINKVGEYGRRVVELVHGGRRFQVTPQERRMNQNAAHGSDQDIFSNGTLRPVSLIDDDPDTERLLANPNILAADDLPKLFTLKGDKFRERIGQITNEATLARVLELARDHRNDASLSQYEALKEREIELRSEVTDPKTSKSDPTPERTPRPVTPR